MMKHFVLLALCLLISAELSPIIAQSSSSNPIMIIRCRFQNTTEGALKSATSKVDDPCPEFRELEPITISSGGECVPICFNGALEMEFPLIDCSTAEAGGLIETTVCFNSTDPASPLQIGQFVALDAITNCLDDAGNEWLPDFLANSGFNPTYDEAGFGPAFDNGGTVQVCATFYVDPSLAVSSNVISDANQAGTVVSATPCPRLGGIPTIGQWSLFILGLLTSCVALSFIASGSRKTT